ncbi:hypothetical protein T11_2634, partial [Trichinella zimbabwensis]
LGVLQIIEFLDNQLDFQFFNFNQDNFKMYLLSSIRREMADRHSVYYATLFALYSLKLHAAFINVVDYIFFNAAFKKHQIASSVQRHRQYVSLASAE